MGFKTTSGGQAEKTEQRSVEMKVSVASPKRQACKGEWEDGAQPAASVPAVTVDVAAAKVSSGELCAVPHEETAAASSGLTFQLTGAPGRRRSSVGSGSQLKAGSLSDTRRNQRVTAGRCSRPRGWEGTSRTPPPCWPARDADNNPLLSPAPSCPAQLRLRAWGVKASLKCPAVC